MKNEYGKDNITGVDNYLKLTAESADEAINGVIYRRTKIDFRLSIS